MLNPFSNHGRAIGEWEKAKVILDKAPIEYDFIKTEYALHAYEYVQSEDIDK
jgi:diacylglycerol kinase family enzyme